MLLEFRSLYVACSLKLSKNQRGKKKYTKINELKNNLIRSVDIKKILIWSDEITQLKLKLSNKQLFLPNGLSRICSPLMVLQNEKNAFLINILLICLYLIIRKV